MSKIYESPDKGETVYERDFGLPERKMIKSKRIQRNLTAMKKQVRIAKSHGLSVKQPHRYVKHHAMDCGVPNCPMCSNPRRKGKKTIQERRADEAEND